MMLALSQHAARKMPPIHQQIALQCARNICQLAENLPKPCTPSGHVPVLVELFSVDENIVYRYQVNMPPNYKKQTPPLMDSNEAKSLNSSFQLPCMVHDPPKDTANAEDLQLLMRQQARHVVHNGNTPQESFSTMNISVQAIEACKVSRDHFRSTLYGQPESPLQFTTLYADPQEAKHQMATTTSPGRVGETADMGNGQIMEAAAAPTEIREVEAPSSSSSTSSTSSSNSRCCLWRREWQLRRTFEREINNKSSIDADRCRQLIQDSWLLTQVPEELQSLFGWNRCQLCHTDFVCVRSALDHYLSRIHLRRVDSWLIRYSFMKGELSEEVMRYLRCSAPNVLHCDLCDLKLTSVSHAQQHFCGRRHRLVEDHQRRPFGEGSYDSEGRWVRAANWITCDLCEISVTSEHQLSVHMAGERHRRRMRNSSLELTTRTINGSHLYRINANGTLAPLNPQTGNYIFAGICREDLLKMNDVSAAFYCEVCNVTLNHAKSVNQHEEGRIHRKNLHRFSLLKYLK